MKTLEFVKKYNLNTESNFNHTEFIADLATDFLYVIEYNKFGHNGLTPNKFNNAVTEIKQKFDSISNKSLCGLPDKLWNYFYATVIVEVKNQEFPDIAEKENFIKSANEKALREFILQNYEVSKYHLEIPYDIAKLISDSIRDGKKTLTFALTRLKYLAENREKKEEQLRDEQWRMQWEKEQENRRRFFNLFSSMLSGSLAPVKEFNLLGITNSENYTEDHVKNAYRKLAMANHPDKGGNAYKFSEITDAKNKCYAYISKLNNNNTSVNI